MKDIEDSYKQEKKALKRISDGIVTSSYEDRFEIKPIKHKKQKQASYDSNILKKSAFIETKRLSDLQSFRSKKNKVSEVP